MAKTPAPSAREPERPWTVTCRHQRTGMQFKGRISEAAFRDLQRVVFGQDDLPFDQPKG